MGHSIFSGILGHSIVTFEINIIDYNLMNIFYYGSFDISYSLNDK